MPLNVSVDSSLRQPDCCGNFSNWLILVIKLDDSLRLLEARVLLHGLSKEVFGGGGDLSAVYSRIAVQRLMLVINETAPSILTGRFRHSKITQPQPSVSDA